MKKKKVLICDRIADEGVELLKGNFSVTVRPKLSESEIVKVVPPYHAMIVRSSTRVTKRIIKAGKSLRIIGRAGIGVDNVDVEAATRAGVVVINAPRANTLAAAEHAISLLLSLCRNIPQANQSIHSGRWERKAFLGAEVLNKTLGVVGLGRIGSLVSKSARGLGMKVIAYDPFVTEEKTRKLGIELATLDRVMKESDFITIHVPLTDQTRHLISTRQFRKMKDGVRIVNCSRGGVIDDAALFKALKDGKVAGAALDVFETEPPPTDYPLFSLPSVIATPHLGASTAEAQVTVALDIAQQFKDFFDGLPPANAINMPSIRPELISVHRPYFTLAEKIGRLHA
ncbi:MAG: phosphoglycerate dehydrogenase, partial [bacterium]